MSILWNSKAINAAIWLLFSAAFSLALSIAHSCSLVNRGLSSFWRNREIVPSCPVAFIFSLKAFYIFQVQIWFLAVGWTAFRNVITFITPFLYNENNLNYRGTGSSRRLFWQKFFPEGSQTCQIKNIPAGSPYPRIIFTHKSLNLVPRHFK